MGYRPGRGFSNILEALAHESYEDPRGPLAGERKWATPAASWSERGATSPEVWAKRQEERVKAGKGRFSDPLHIQVAVPWPTPRATDAANGGPNQRGSKGDLMLPSAVQPHNLPQAALKWATPTRRDGMGGPGRQGREGGPNLRTQIQEDVRTWPTPQSRDFRAGSGEHAVRDQASSNLNDVAGGPSGSVLLNPDWVEMLQGLPVGWSNPEVPNEELFYTPFPAGRGPLQYEFEPPRTCPPGVKNRPARVKALGNLCVPQQIAVLFAAIDEVDRQLCGS